MDAVRPWRVRAAWLEPWRVAALVGWATAALVAVYALTYEPVPGHPAPSSVQPAALAVAAALAVFASVQFGSRDRSTAFRRLLFAVYVLAPVAMVWLYAFDPRPGVFVFNFAGIAQGALLLRSAGGMTAWAVTSGSYVVSEVFAEDLGSEPADAGLVIVRVVVALFVGALAGRAADELEMQAAGRRRAEHALAETEERLQLLVDSVLDYAIFMLDAGGSIATWNRGAERIYGYAEDEVLGRSFSILCDPDEEIQADRELAVAVEEGRFEGEVRRRRRDGDRFWTAVVTVPVRDETGGLVGFAKVTRDITERRRADVEIARVNRAYRALSRSNQALVRAVDERELLDGVCRALVEEGDYPAVCFVRPDGDEGPWVSAASGIDRETAERELVGGGGVSGLLESGIRSLEPVTASFPVGDAAVEGWRAALDQDLLSVAVLPVVEEDRPVGALLIWAREAEAFHEQEMQLLTEMTEDVKYGIRALRTKAEREEAIEILRRTDRQRRRLLAMLVSAQEDERRQIAQDVHDDSIQVMTAVGMRLGTLRRHLDNPEERETIIALEEVVEESIGRLRRLVFELHPRALDEEGLVAALRLYLDRLREESRTEFVIVDRLTDEPDPEARTVLYRIAQEALTNVRKHARAARANVALEEREGGFLVRVTDDGVGFDPEEADVFLPGHLGLSSLRERAQAAGGWCRVESEPGRGTVVESWVPPAE